MKKILMTLTITFGLITIINAQGITNTLGGITFADKFIVENSDHEIGLLVMGNGNVRIGNFESFDPSLKLTVRGEYPYPYPNGAWTNIKSGVEELGYGVGLGTGILIGYGVKGEAEGHEQNFGVFGEAKEGESSSSCTGVYGRAEGFIARGVSGFAKDTYQAEGIGGYFRTMDESGSGVYGYVQHATGVNYGVRGGTDSPNGWAGYFEGRGYFRENVGIGTTTPTSKLSIVGLIEYADNAAATSAGLVAGDLYRTGDFLKIVH